MISIREKFGRWLNSIVEMVQRKPYIHSQSPLGNWLNILNEDEKCPDCFSKMFLRGPEGGASMNIKCFGCEHCFNYSPPFTPERISDSGCYYGKPTLLKDL